MPLPPEYRPRYVSFIDILGFEAKVARITDDHSVFDQLIDIHSVIENAALDARGAATFFDISDVQWAAFSDTIVITMPETAYRMSNLYAVVMGTMVLCQRLLELGTLARGGVAKGQVYHKGSVMFGPGVIDAYHLEHELAGVARVAVSPEVAREWQTTYVPPNDLAMRDLIKQDRDGVFFLDLFFFPENDLLDRGTHGFFTKSRSVIEQLLSDGGLHLRQWSKVAWLAN